jgi:hypothetical protein
MSRAVIAAPDFNPDIAGVAQVRHPLRARYLSLPVVTWLR